MHGVDSNERTSLLTQSTLSKTNYNILDFFTVYNITCIICNPRQHVRTVVNIIAVRSFLVSLGHDAGKVFHRKFLGVEFLWNHNQSDLSNINRQVVVSLFIELLYVDFIGGGGGCLVGKKTCLMTNSKKFFKNLNERICYHVLSIMGQHTKEISS